METLSLIIITILAIALVVVWLKLYSHRRAQQLDIDALSLTPVGDVNVTGHWQARQETDDGYVLWGATLTQHGKTITGWMQCKLAAAHPLAIRAILQDDRVVGTWSRPHREWMGSGTIDLTLSPDGNTLTGTTRWYDAKNDNGQAENWKWKRTTRAEGVWISVAKGMSGAMGGLIGHSAMKRKTMRIFESLQAFLQQRSGGR